MSKENIQKYYIKTGPVLSSYRTMEFEIKYDVGKVSGKE